MGRTMHGSPKHHLRASTGARISFAGYDTSLSGKWDVLGRLCPRELPGPAALGGASRRLWLRDDRQSPRTGAAHWWSGPSDVEGPPLGRPYDTPSRPAWQPFSWSRCGESGSTTPLVQHPRDLGSHRGIPDLGARVREVSSNSPRPVRRRVHARGPTGPTPKTEGPGGHRAPRLYARHGH